VTEICVSAHHQAGSQQYNNIHTHISQAVSVLAVTNKMIIMKIHNYSALGNEFWSTIFQN